MDPTAKMIIILNASIFFGGIILLKVFYAIKSWNEDRIFWHQLNVRLKKRDEVFMYLLLNELKKNKEFNNFIQSMALIQTKNPEPKQTRFKRLKQWVINIF